MPKRFAIKRRENETRGDNDVSMMTLSSIKRFFRNKLTKLLQATDTF